MQKVLNALLECKKELTEVTKDGVLPANLGGKRATSIENVVREVRTVMTKHGLLLIPERSVLCEGAPTLPDKDGKPPTQFLTRVRISYALYHVDGEKYPESIVIEAEGADGSDKGAAKAYAFARKLILFDLLQLPRGDDPEIDRKATNEVNKPAFARPGFAKKGPVGEPTGEIPVDLGFGIKP